jgi:hypothetical protein
MWIRANVPATVNGETAEDAHALLGNRPAGGHTNIHAAKEGVALAEVQEHLKRDGENGDQRGSHEYQGANAVEEPIHHTYLYRYIHRAAIAVQLDQSSMQSDRQGGGVYPERDGYRAATWNPELAFGDLEPPHVGV